MARLLPLLAINDPIDPVLGSFIVLLVIAAIAIIFAKMLTIFRKNRKNDRGRRR